MEATNLKAILKTYGLRVTDCRLGVIQLFLETKGALSQGDLESKFKQYDRVTLYRTLNSFLEYGILHRIPSESGTATYGLSYSEDTSTNHNHIHFKCNDCGQIECLTDQKIPPIALPKGYKKEKVNLIVDGICAACS